MPVRARTTTSRPANTVGSVSACTGNSVVNPAAFRALTTGFERSKSSTLDSIGGAACSSSSDVGSKTDASVVWVDGNAAAAGVLDVNIDIL